MNIDLFEIVTFPDVQYLMEMDGFNENAYLVNDENGLAEFGSSAYFVRCSWMRRHHC